MTQESTHEQVRYGGGPHGLGMIAVKTGFFKQQIDHQLHDLE